MISPIVIIDDDQAVCHSLRWLLQSAGYNTISYRSAMAYLKSADTSGSPACIILDVHMPEMNGFELYPLIKDRFPGVPIFFVTGYPDQAAARNARQLGAAGLFSKPLDTEELLDQIGRLTPTHRVLYG